MCKDRLKNSLDKPADTGNGFQNQGNSSEIHPLKGFSFLFKG